MKSSHSLNILTLPTLLPVSLVEMKEYLRIVHTQHDNLVNDLILSAVDQLREDTNFVPSLTTFQYKQDNVDDPYNHAWDSDIVIYLNNVNEITTFTYINTDGETITMEEGTDYEADLEYPVRIKLLNSIEVEEGYKKIQVTLTAGYNNADNIPAIVKQGIKYLVAHYYENPTPAVSGTMVSTVPDTYTRLINLPIFKRVRV